MPLNAAELEMSEKGLLEKLLETLRELPLVQVHDEHWEVYLNDIGKRVDAAIDLDLPGRDSVRLLVEAKKSIYPRDVRNLLWDFREYHNLRNSPDVFLIAAESMSPGAKDMLQKEQVGYFDSGGSLFIPARSAYILIQKPPAKTIEKTVRGLFTGKRSQVVHALLLHPEKWLSVKKLSDLAQVSPSTASQTLGLLERFGWVNSEGEGPAKKRMLSAPKALLDEWARIVSAMRPLTFDRYYVSAKSTEHLVELLSLETEIRDVECVLTQETAAQHYAPFLTSVPQLKCRMQAGRAVKEIIEALEAKVVSEGANLLIHQTKTTGEFLFKRRDEGLLWLASPVQVYLDLLRGGGRAKEVAENLRREKIGF